MFARSVLKPVLTLLVLSFAAACSSVRANVDEDARKLRNELLRSTIVTQEVTDFAPTAVAPTPKATLKADPTSDDCDVWMFLVAPILLSQTPAGTLAGYERYPTDETLIASEPLCIKRDQDFGLPQDISLRRYLPTKTSPAIDKRLCSAKSERVTLPDEDGKGFFQTCRWNRRYLHALPFDVVLTTQKRSEQPDQVTTRLADHLTAFRIFLNGSAAYQWNGRAPAAKSAHTVIVHGSELKFDLIPFDAPFDIRALPATEALPADYFAEYVRNTGDAQKAVIERLKKATVAAFPDEATHVKCLRQQLDLLNAQAGRIAGQDVTLPTVPDECGDLVSKEDETLRELWDEVKAKGASHARDAAAKLDTRAQSALNRVNVDATEVAEHFKTWATGSSEQIAVLELVEPHWKDGMSKADFRTAVANALSGDEETRALRVIDGQLDWPWLRFRLGAGRIEAIVRQVDALVSQTIAIADSSRAFVKNLKDTTTELVGSTDRQSEAFARLAESLADTSVFEQYTKNPAPIPGESVLEMTYRDWFQTYYLHVWHALPIKVKPRGNAIDLNIDSLVPFLDLIGKRYQFGRSRFAEIRGAIGFGYIRDEVALDAGGREEQPLGVAQVNLTAGPLQFGVGVAVIASGAVRFPVFADRVRLLLGADLVQLLSGRFVSADSSGDGAQSTP